MTTMNADQDHGSAYTTHLFGGLSGRVRVASGEATHRRSIAHRNPRWDIHLSVLRSARAILSSHALRHSVFPALALDRPGYGESPSLPFRATRQFRTQADALIAALEDAWRQYGATTHGGSMLIGHSIGGAIATWIAARSKTLPLIGLAVSGVGLRVPPHFPDQWREALPEGPTVEFPVHLKDMVMFGPEGSFDDSMPAASHAADSLATAPGDHRYSHHMARGRAGCSSPCKHSGALPTGRV